MNKNAYEEMFAVEDTHWWYVGLHNLVLVLSNNIFAKKPLKILDAGCGTGGLLSILSKAGHEVDGVDYSDEALNFCRKRNLQNVIKADINEWKPSQNTYDLITSFDVLSHEWVVDEIQTLKALAVGLKDGGYIMLNYPAFPILRRRHDNVVMMRKRYTKKMLRNILTEADLEPIILSYRIPHAFVVLLLLRFFENLRIDLQDAKSDIATTPTGFINNILIKAIMLENQIISQGLSIPFGSSLFTVAKKIA